MSITQNSEVNASCIERPEIVKDNHLHFLDELRESGEINMFGARPYLAREFDITDKEAGAILSYWMKSFNERAA